MARKSKYAVPASCEQTAATWRAGLYCRLSVEDGDDAGYNSIENQKKIALHFLRGHPDITLLEAYADNGFTGMDFRRPGFGRLLADLESGKLNCVLIKDFSRLGRQLLATSELVEKSLPAMGVRLISINDEYDSEKPNAGSSGILPFQLVMNDAYVRDISKKIRSSIDSKIQQGTFLPASGSVPYGYLRNADAGSFDPDPETAGVVARLFALRAAGESCNAIARLFNQENIPSPGRLRYLRGSSTDTRYTHALWGRATVKKIAGDPVYLGNRVHGRAKRDRVGTEKTRRPAQSWQIVAHAHPPLIAPALFEQVQDVAERERTARDQFTTRAEAETDYRPLFRGKVYCGGCGAPMTAGKSCARPGSHAPSRIFFNCGQYQSSGKTRCSSRYVRQEVLLQVVKDALDAQLALAADLEQLLRELDAAPGQREPDELASVRLRLKNLDSKLEQLLLSLAEGLIDRAEYDYMKSAYAKQRQTLLQTQARLAAGETAAKSARQNARRFLQTLKAYGAAPVPDRAVVEALVARIVVSDASHIRVELNYADPIAPVLALRKAGAANAG